MLPIFLPEIWIFAENKRTESSKMTFSKQRSPWEYFRIEFSNNFSSRLSILMLTSFAWIKDVLINIPVQVFEKGNSEFSKLVRNASDGILEELFHLVGNFKLIWMILGRFHTYKVFWPGTKGALMLHVSY